MRNAVWISAGMLATAVVAALVLRQATGDPHIREVGFAAAITVFSAVVAVLPLALVAKTSPVAVFQAAFGGTVAHLFLTLALGAAAHTLGRVDRSLFLFLLLAFYWVSLLIVVLALIKVFRRAFPKHASAAATDAAAAKTTA